MYRRIILKLSGEALGSADSPFQKKHIQDYISQIKSLVQVGTQVGIIVGGGNFWRGRSADPEMDRTVADSMGMMATVMNGLYLSDAFRRLGLNAVVQTPFPVGAFTEAFTKLSALAHMEKGTVVIFAGGIGHPFFSTDTIAALRGAELAAEGLFFAKNVDGVYDSDPMTNPQAKKFASITSKELVEKNLKVIDVTAANLCWENKIPVILFALQEENSIINAVKGKTSGTVILPE